MFVEDTLLYFRFREERRNLLADPQNLTMDILSLRTLKTFQSDRLPQVHIAPRRRRHLVVKRRVPCYSKVSWSGTNNSFLSTVWRNPTAISSPTHFFKRGDRHSPQPASYGAVELNIYDQPIPILIPSPTSCIPISRGVISHIVSTTCLSYPGVVCIARTHFVPSVYICIPRFECHPSCASISRSSE